MPNIHDNDFDSWIKNSLENPSIGFDPEAWKLMEKKLDRPVILWVSLINVFSLVTSISIIAYLTLFNLGYEIANRKNVVNKINEPSVTLLEPVLPYSIFYDNKGLKSFNENSTESVTINSHEAKSPKNIADQGSEKKRQTINKGSSLINSGWIKKTESLQKKVISLKEEPLKHSTISYSIAKVAPIGYDLVNTAFDLQAGKIKKGAEIQTDKEIGLNKHPKINLTVFFSPDISTVNFPNAKGTGINTGFSIEYLLSSRWRILTGIIKSNKIYDVQKNNGYGYTSPTPSNLEGIDAICSVLDIPINIRYDINPSEKGSLFISTGLSSYLMLKEDYEFHYKNYYNSYTNNISIRGENQHFFQILNFSMGYERSLGNRFAIQGEPFLKIPFKNVGYGQVRLLSTGIFIAFKYKIY